MAKKLVPKGKKAFLLIDKAPGHTANDVKAEQDKVWSKGRCKFQAGKIPDKNDFDVRVFSFMKRGIGACSGALTEAELHVEAKKAWGKVTPAVCKAARARVLRKITKALEFKGGNWHGESRT